MECKIKLISGRDKSAYIAALQQAKFNPPRQLRQPQCTSRNPRATSWIAARELRQLHIWSCRNARAAAMHELNYIPPRGLWQVVHCWGGAAVGVEAPQYKSFYTFPLISERIFWELKQMLWLNIKLPVLKLESNNYLLERFFDPK